MGTCLSCFKDTEGQFEKNTISREQKISDVPGYSGSGGSVTAGFGWPTCHWGQCRHRSDGRLSV